MKKRDSRVPGKLSRFILLGSIGCILVTFSIIPIRRTIAAYQAPHPQAILVLGGDPSREVAAAQMAQVYPDLDVWISSGPSVKESRKLFRETGIPDRRLHIDLRATDTVTNFTTLVNDFKQRQFKHVFIITSDFHMPRSKAIATIVLGSQGITFTPVSVPSSHPQEPLSEVIRDSGRSLLWIFTGRTGSSLKERLNEVSINSDLWWKRE